VGPLRHFQKYSTHNFHRSDVVCKLPVKKKYSERRVIRYRIQDKQHYMEALGANSAPGTTSIQHCAHINCKICNVCVATFDHHGLFLDTCIGERNHFRFWLFLILNIVEDTLQIIRSGYVAKEMCGRKHIRDYITRSLNPHLKTMS
jgi:hypothetical protein